MKSQEEENIIVQEAMESDTPVTHVKALTKKNQTTFC